MWGPVNIVTLGVMPQHLRIAYVSTLSAAWSSYCSYVAHTDMDAAGASEACAGGGTIS